MRAAAGLIAAGSLAALGLLASGCAAAPTQSIPSSPLASPASTRPANAQPTSPAARAKLLAGKVVGIDPGHNGLNGTDPAFINHLIWNGREWEHCNTTGTQTDSGYTEARFNFNVATYLAADLRALGAKVVLTRRNNHGVGPCVDTRSFLLNHTDVAIDIHADGGPSSGRGFTVLEPVPDRQNAAVIAASMRFGRYVHQAFLTDTPLRPSDYYGHNGYIVRNDLAGLNLTTVPKVLIECGNMRSAADAAILTSPRGQREIARALLAAIVRFLTGRWPGR